MATGLARQFAQQLARPSGRVGQLLGGAMDLANRGPTRLAVDLLAPVAGERILDAGCGTGAALAQVLRRAPCHVSGFDPSPIMIAAAVARLGERADLREGGLADPPFSEGSFDAALLLNVLYFCDDEGRMVDNLRRMLRPGGRLVAYVTHRETMEHWPFARAGLHRLYDENELTAALTAGGFALPRISVHPVRVTRKVRGLLAYAER